MKRRKTSDPEVPEWIMTFADMVSLLVTFFILLLTYSSMEKEKLAKLSGIMAGAFGFIADPKTQDNQALTDPPPADSDRVNDDGIRASRTDLNRIQEAAKIMVRKPHMGSLVEIERVRDGVRMRVQANGTFGAGRTGLSPECEQALGEIADFLRVHSNNFVVTGHAWQEGDEPAMLQLSTARAIAAADYLRTYGEVADDRIMISAAVDHDPISRGDDPRSAQENRRIDIFVLPVSE